MKLRIGNRKVKVRELNPAELNEFEKYKNKNEALNYLKKIKAFEGRK